MDSKRVTLPQWVVVRSSLIKWTISRNTQKVCSRRWAEEPGTLAFEFSVQPDGKTVDLLEIYQNAEAFVAHVKHMRATFKPEENPRKPGKITVFGSPNAELKEMLARREPVYETYIDGFMR